MLSSQTSGLLHHQLLCLSAFILSLVFLINPSSKQSGVVTIKESSQYLHKCEH